MAVIKPTPDQNNKQNPLSGAAGSASKPAAVHQGIMGAYAKRPLSLEENIDLKLEMLKRFMDEKKQNPAPVKDKVVNQMVFGIKELLNKKK